MIRSSRFALIPTVGVFLLVSVIRLLGQSQATSIDLPLSHTYDGSFYFNSTGGKTANGCEAWATLTSSDEYIYAARCDAERLAKLEFRIREAIAVNNQLDTNRRLTNSDTFLMIDYTGSKAQTMVGKTQNDALVYLILDPSGKYIYYRAVGQAQQLRQLGFPVTQALIENAKLPSDKRIVVDSAKLNLVLDVVTQSYQLVGKDNSGKTAGLLLDKSGNYLRYLE